MADSLEKDVLPKWQMAIEELDSFGKQSIVNPEFLARLHSYLLKRKERIQLLVEGLRDNDQQKLDQSMTARSEADKLRTLLFPDDSP